MYLLRFQILTAASIKVTVLWDTASVISLIMEVLSTSETSIKFCETRVRSIAESCHLQFYLLFVWMLNLVHNVKGSTQNENMRTRC
jgi:hypothetical protein